MVTQIQHKTLKGWALARSASGMYTGRGSSHYTGIKLYTDVSRQSDVVAAQADSTTASPRLVMRSRRRQPRGTPLEALGRRRVFTRFGFTIILIEVMFRLSLGHFDDTRFGFK